MDGHLYAVNAGTGKRIWEFSTGGAINSSPVERNGILYIGSNDGQVYAIIAAGE
ncbi:MAG: hypothetical protein D6770_05375 [Anaerolineae bacterium]|nr:MAG: hypothetical protein D6770_05375 [Anaerolineae bacterium]